MKRQRGASGKVNGGLNSPIMNASRVEEVAVAMGMKKAKKLEGGEQKKKKVEEEEEEKENRDVVGGGGGLSQSQSQSQRDGHVVNVMGWNWEEYMPWLGGDMVEYEQMSWGSTWFPGWDMDFMDEAFNPLYSDVVWDDDIWNLNNQIPIPLHAKRFD